MIFKRLWKKNESWKNRQFKSYILSKSEPKKSIHVLQILVHQIYTEYSHLNIFGHVRLPSLIQDDYRKKSNHDSDLEKRAMQLWLMMHTISMSWHKIHWFNFFFLRGHWRQHLNSCIRTFFLEAKLFPVFLVRIEFWSKLHIIDTCNFFVNWYWFATYSQLEIRLRPKTCVSRRKF